ncbi:MAG: ABC transporter permease [Oscillospiraceae bacterium]|nr:ABC transporter permease [Oscillospiraceae bacterium]
MKLTQKLAYSQLKKNRRRTLWTLTGVILSAAMITAVYGVAASGSATFTGLMGEYEYDTGAYFATIFGIGAILSLMIAAVSVVVVSNAFRVSAGERTAQFGILKSVGATKRQITGTVMYEGVFLSMIGIPAGIGLGLLVQLAGIEAANYFLQDMNAMRAFESPIIFRFVFAWPALLAPVVISFAAVLISAWLPARKAAKIAAINAIRRMGEVQIKTKPIRSNPLIQRFFGFEGVLASKFLKRSKRHFRASVISIVLGVVLFITANSIGAYGSKAADMLFPNIDAAVVGQFFTSIEFHYSEDGAPDVKYTALDSDMADNITEKLREFPDVTVYGIGSGSFLHSATIPPEMLTPPMERYLVSQGYTDPSEGIPVVLVAPDTANYAALCRLAGVPAGSNILVNYARERMEGRMSEFEQFVFGHQTLRLTSESESPVEIPLHGELKADIPAEILFAGDASGSFVRIIVPQTQAFRYNWFVQTDDIDGFSAYAYPILADTIPPGETAAEINVMGLSAAIEAARNVYKLVMVFIYGFVGMLMLIGLTNVISTLSANVRSRAREFAVLKSVGMTQPGLNRMLNFESVLSSAKSLVIGLPLGITASYLTYRSILLSIDFSYSFPWLAVMQCILGVLGITWVTMRYASSRMRSGNIIETIRGLV